MEKPNHIAIILDGNRRFAKSLNQDVWKGHEYGYKKVGKLLEWCKEENIKELTLYVFSIQNFNRPKKEFEYLMNLFLKASKEALNQKNTQDLNVKFIGRTQLLPQNVQQEIKKITTRTKQNKKYQLNIAIAYGAREEIEDAITQITKDIQKQKINPQQINQELIKKYLYLQTEPDLIIRTGGEKRTSNFLAWQSTYSEWLFLNKKWPEFTKSDFKKAIQEYSKRDRRKGK